MVKSYLPHILFMSIAISCLYGHAIFIISIVDINKKKFNGMTD